MGRRDDVGRDEVEGRRFEDLDGIAQHEVTDAVLRGRRVEDPDLRPAARSLADSQRRGYGIVTVIAGSIAVAAVALAILLPDVAPPGLVFAGVVTASLVAVWAFVMHRSARRATVANGTDQVVPLTVPDRLAAIAPAAFIGLMSTWLLRALVGAVVGGLDVTVHPAVGGVPLGLVSLGVAVAAYQRILADWHR